MKQYLDLLQHVMDHGELRDDRTGTGTKSVFGYQLRVDLQKGFPLLTTKKTYLHGVVTELLWFMQGDTNVEYLNTHRTHIWDEWATKFGDLGPIYGYQWRSWPTSNEYYHIDQISEVVKSIKENPNSRRHLVSAWNPDFLPDEKLSPQENVEAGSMALPPCHVMFQFYVSKGKLSCHLYQRSADAFLGVPFNIASYALLTHLIAKECDLEVGDFIHSFGDLHIYKNHFEQVELQLTRKPDKLPTLVIADKGLFDYEPSDITVTGYAPQGAIKAEISI